MWTCLSQTLDWPRPFNVRWLRSPDLWSPALDNGCLVSIMWNLYLPPYIGCKIYSLDFFCPGHHSLVWKCSLGVLLGLNWSKMVVVLKICPFCEVLWNWRCGGWCLCDCWCPSFYPSTIRLRPMFWRANKLGFWWVLSLFKFGWGAKRLWRSIQKPSGLLLGTEGNLPSCLGNLRENALILQGLVQLAVASFLVGLLHHIFSATCDWFLSTLTHTEQTKVNDN